MNTDLSPEITRTCSKGHVKIATNNSFRLCRNNIRLQCLELSNNMLQQLIMAKKAWHANTKGKEQNSLTELIPNINRKHGSIHANMANDMTDLCMAGTTISRHVGELVPFTTEQYMACQGSQQ